MSTPKSSKPTEAGVPSPTDRQPQGVSVLRDALSAALVYGRQLAKSSLSPMIGSRWIRAKIADLAEDAPDIFASGSNFRKAAIAALKAAIVEGHESYQDSPELPPSKARFEHHLDALLESFFLGSVLEDLADIDEGDLLDPPELSAQPIYSVIDDAGIHRIRSNFMRDEDGSLYQLIVVRDREDITIYRRYSGDTDATPVLGGYTTTEANFVSMAFAEIRSERGEVL